MRVSPVYHGSRVPYLRKFDWRKQGTGIVTSTKLGGFFFTSSPQNAAYYADFDGERPDSAFIVRARLTFKKLFVAPEGAHPPTVVRDIGKLFHPYEGENYDGVLCPDTFDGDRHSDIYFVFDPCVIKVQGYTNPF